ncbi:hypothetical protein [Pacificispira sp.]|uniref:hypothetical protein n=1 Tax=Pacificispira sp. TaxID=2888761 RepID=UPI003BAA6BD2
MPTDHSPFPVPRQNRVREFIQSFSPEDLRNCSVVVANRTGGQGKTLVAQLVSLCFEGAGITKHLAAADTADLSRCSKLGKLFREQVTELGLGATIDAVRSDPNRAVAHWDALGELLCAGDVVVDLGANLVDMVWDWAAARQAGSILRSPRIPRIVLVVPVRAQAQALEDAFTVLERSIKENDNLPLAGRILVLNEASGPFSQYGNNSDFERIQAMKHNAGLKVMSLAQCRSEIWPTLERNHVPIAKVARMETNEFGEEFGLDRFAASGARADFLTWLEKIIADFQRIGLVPPAPKERESRG